MIAVLGIERPGLPYGLISIPGCPAFFSAALSGARSFVFNTSQAARVTASAFRAWSKPLTASGDGALSAPSTAVATPSSAPPTARRLLSDFGGTHHWPGGAAPSSSRTRASRASRAAVVFAVAGLPALCPPAGGLVHAPPPRGAPAPPPLPPPLRPAHAQF